MAQPIGHKLKEIRESKGISLEEISHKTHIRLNYLDAIESNDLDQLPSPVQMRGFLRLYASELGIDLKDLEVEGYQKSGTHSNKDYEEEQGEPDETRKPASQETFEVEDERDDESDVEHTLIMDSEIKMQPDLEKPGISETEYAGYSTAIFKAIGAKLQARRRLLSLSYDDIANNLHIRKVFLKALEAGEFEVLPSPVQARGMLANYAEFLNLDVDALLLEYADGLQEQRIEKQEKNAVNERKSAKELSETRLRLKNFFSVDLLMITALFLGFAFFVIWGVNRILSADENNLQTTDIPEVADVLLATGTPTPQISITLIDTQPTSNPSETTPEEPTPIFTSLPNNSPINIVIIPRQSTWVQITTDGEVSYVGRLIVGNVYDYSGDNTVEIRTGNAGALQIFFNDQDIGSPGLIGQVVNLIFTESGLVQPTPTNTPTITETPRPSPSPTVSPTATQTRIPTATPTEVND